MIRTNPLGSTHKKMYTINIFSTLINSYPSFQDLQAFLTSEEGGNLRFIESEQESPYVIIRYVKGRTNLQDESKPWVPWFRSVVWNKNTNRPVCVAPRKAMFTEIPSHESPVIEDFVEGVMVNGFLNEKSEIEITTRSKLGGTSGYYSSKSFAEMFEEAKQYHSITNETLQESMNKNGIHFVSFVLQHPEHRVVQKIYAPKLYCVHLGTVQPNGDVTFYETSTEWPEGHFQNLRIPSHGVLAPGKSPMEVLKNSTNAWATTWQGFVYRGQQGQRWRYRTTQYTALRDLRGKESRVEDRFVRIRAAGKVPIYLKTWPEDKRDFSQLETKFRSLTKQIYMDYCEIHKAHRKTIHDIHFIFKGVMYELHNIYLSVLRQQNQTLKLQHVIDYMNTLPLDGQANLLREKV